MRVLQLDHCWRASLPAETLQLTDAVLVNLSFAIQNQTQLFAIGNNASVSVSLTARCVNFCKVFPDEHSMAIQADLGAV